MIFFKHWFAFQSNGRCTGFNGHSSVDRFKKNSSKFCISSGSRTKDVQAYIRPYVNCERSIWTMQSFICVTFHRKWLEFHFGDTVYHRWQGVASQYTRAKKWARTDRDVKGLDCIDEEKSRRELNTTAKEEERKTLEKKRDCVCVTVIGSPPANKLAIVVYLFTFLLSIIPILCGWAACLRNAFRPFVLFFLFLFLDLFFLSLSHRILMFVFSSPFVSFHRMCSDSLLVFSSSSLSLSCTTNAC